MYGSPLERRSTCNQNHFRNRCGSLIFLDKLYPAICVYFSITVDLIMYTVSCGSQFCSSCMSSGPSLPLVNGPLLNYHAFHPKYLLRHLHIAWLFYCMHCESVGTCVPCQIFPPWITWTHLILLTVWKLTTVPLIETWVKKIQKNWNGSLCMLSNGK